MGWKYNPATGQNEWTTDSTFNNTSTFNPSMNITPENIAPTQVDLGNIGTNVGSGAPGRTLGNGLGIFDQQYTDGSGAILTQPGWGKLGLGAFNAWNAWNQGNKMYDLQKDALDFSKDQFWNNFLMQRDQYNRKVNRYNKLQNAWSAASQGNYNPETAAQIDADYNRSGDAVREYDGTLSNVTNVPTEYYGDNYGTQIPQTNQSAFVKTATPITQQTATDKVASRPTTMGSTNPNATQNQRAKPQAVKSAFNRRKLGA